MWSFDMWDCGSLFQLHSCGVCFSSISCFFGIFLCYLSTIFFFWSSLTSFMPCLVILLWLLFVSWVGKQTSGKCGLTAQNSKEKINNTVNSKEGTVFPGDEFVPKQMQEAAALAGKGKNYRCVKVVIPSFSDTSSNVDRKHCFSTI